MSGIVEITTEVGDIGSEHRSLGFFKGTDAQAIAYLAANEILPGCYYHVNKVTVKDVTNVQLGSYAIVLDAAGKVKTFTGKLSANLIRDTKVAKALAKLSDEELKLIDTHFANMYLD